MPAHRLSNEIIAIAHCDVVGQDAEGGRFFIRHVAMAASDHESVRSNSPITVNHMGPPLERNGQLTAHVFGKAGLDDDQLRQVELFLDELLREQQAQLRRQGPSGGSRFTHYIVHPHSDLSPDGAFRRFSCAGFVLEAYGEAGITLIEPEGELPQVRLDELYNFYPELARFEANPGLRGRLNVPSREELGLVGDGPWPVVLPNYVFHSLAREVDAIRQGPYTVLEGDQHFPHQP